MQILFIFSLVFAILVSIFAVMNSEPVTIKLLWKEFQFSQAIVILGSAVFGAVIVALLGVFNKVKSSLKIRELQNKIKSLEKEIQELKPAETINEEISHENATNDNLENVEQNIIEDVKPENEEEKKL
ncbi:MAG: LapA family protein [Maledivibacter sp.]|jgi:uncharacterized integral membrane protein|nr:LapA family protein [Maledivibacter sp.]